MATNSLRIFVLVLVGMVCIALPRLEAASGTWTYTSSSLWGTASNWTGGIVASGIDSTASFIGNITGNVVVGNNTGTTAGTWSGTIGNIYLEDTTPSASTNWFIGSGTDTTSKIQLDVTSGSPTITAANGAPTIRVILTGSRGFAKEGVGRLTLARANTYTGTTTINSGTLTLGVADAVQNSVVASNVNNGLSFVSGVGTFNVGGLSGATSQVLTDTSSIAITLNVGGSGISSAYSGTLSGAGALTKSGTGTLTLSGNNTYTGTTTISAGTLLVSGTLANTAAVSVGPAGTLTVDGRIGGSTSLIVDGTLKGSGVIAGATTINGTLSPGNSPGVETFGNGLTLANDSNFVFELMANTAAGSDRGVFFDGVNITGAGLTLQSNVTFSLTLGGTVDFGDAFWSTAQSWLVFDLASGAITGSFANLNVSGLTPSGGFFSLSNVGNDLYLNWTAVPEPSTWVLLGVAGMAALFFRRRGSTGTQRIGK